MLSQLPASRPLRILLCQGESPRARELVEYLEQDGYEVECVRGGNGTCLAAALRFQPHVLVVEENSIRLSIVKLCRTLQRSEETQHLPVVACVGDVSPDRVERFEQAGVTEILAAPTTPSLIVHCMKRLEQGGALREPGSKAGGISLWASERAAFEACLRQAEEREELSVCYQPRVDAATGDLLGMECLVRWNHPQFGCVPPDQFIPLAEETGLINSIGEWVLREACTQAEAWRQRGHTDLRVSVNLSAIQFRDSDLYETVQRALRDTGLPAEWLELEVTESILMGDPSETALTLERLKSLGLHVSIDDFGTGYSSLSYLKRFPIDTLKIDRSFVDGITSDPDDAAIATAIVLMGHSLRLRVVGEGVETTDQQTLLHLLGCDEIQGYLISPPIPAPAFEQHFLNRSQKVA